MTPSLADLARELCSSLGECGEVEQDRICVRKKHEDEQHKFVLMTKVIPIN